MISMIVAGVVALPLVGFSLLLDRPWNIIALAGVVIVTLLAIVRSTRVSIAIGPEAVSIDNFGRSYRLPWQSIEAVQITTRSMIEEGPAEAIEFVLRSGGNRVLSQASLGRARRRAKMLSAIEPYARAWDIPMP